MPDLDLSITICSWNTQADLRRCLQSLEEAQGEAAFEVIVVDNASRDGSPDMVRTEFPWVRLLAQTENLGFTGGHNLALSQRAAPAALLLNSDTIVHPGALRELMAYAGSHPEVGILGPKLLNGDGSLQFSCRRFPNPVAALFRNTFIGRLFPNNPYTRDYLMQDWDHDRPREVDWVSGAAMLVTGPALDVLKGFDPAYFMFCEDVDLCWRCWEAKFKVVYLPAAEITHLIGQSTSQVANKMIVRFHRSMMRFYVRNQLPKSPLLFRPLGYLFALGGLSARATLFLVKNAVDAMRRRITGRP